MREISDGAEGTDGAGMCRLWGAKVKGEDLAAPDRSGTGARRAGRDAPTRGGRIGAGTFVVPARNSRYAPVIAAFAPKATAVPADGLARFRGHPGTPPIGGDGSYGRNSAQKTRSCGCGCGGRSGKKSCG